jgi:hypothetical protein
VCRTRSSPLTSRPCRPSTTRSRAASSRRPRRPSSSPARRLAIRAPATRPLAGPPPPRPALRTSRAAALPLTPLQLTLSLRTFQQRGPHHPGQPAGPRCAVDRRPLLRPCPLDGPAFPNSLLTFCTSRERSALLSLSIPVQFYSTIPCFFIRNSSCTSLCSFLSVRRHPRTCPPCLLSRTVVMQNVIASTGSLAPWRDETRSKGPP